MTVSPKDIAWGTYKEYAGPYFRGSIKYVLPIDPSEADKRLRVLTATEGGRLDAINAYDRCVISVGLIQWCEGRYYLVSKLLHALAEELGPDAVRVPLEPALTMSCAEFKKNAKGSWRFHFRDARGEVNTLEKQQQLFLGCDGRQASWTNITRAHAKLWAAAMANVWTTPEAQDVQVRYTVKRLTSFLMPEGKAIMWDDQPDEGPVGAMRAAYLSFAGNLPAVANKHVQLANERLTSPKWSDAWCIGILQELTFGPGIAIYPHRYDKIRPWLESLWDHVDLPKTSDELKAWTEDQRVNEPLPIDAAPDLMKELIDDMKPTKPTDVEPSDNDKDAIVLRPPAEPVIQPSLENSTGILGWILYILHLIMNFFMKVKESKNE